jgi:hypothetical protein
MMDRPLGTDRHDPPLQAPAAPPLDQPHWL